MFFFCNWAAEVMGRANSPFYDMGRLKRASFTRHFGPQLKGKSR
jgi:hypothetical protein